MPEWMHGAHRWLTDVQGIVQWGGTVLVCIIVFMVTGLFVGFFLPGDPRLATAGVFAATGRLDLATLLILVSLCAVARDQPGYWIGWRAGEALYQRDDSFFPGRSIFSARDFYEKHSAP